ncbi:MAG TPA: histidine kinase, partial [Rhodanobacteraceae bacterium]
AYYAINGGTAPPWLQSLLWAAAQWYPWALFAPLAMFAARRFGFGDGASSVLRGAQHALLAATLAVIHAVLQSLLLWFVLPNGRAFLGNFTEGSITLLATTFHFDLLTYAVVIAMAYVVFFLRRSRFEALARRELETETARAQFAALQRQMQPHFLFNALNALVSMQREDSAEQRFTLRLAGILRQLLETGERATATLADEVALVEAYLYVEHARLGSRLNACIDVPPSLRAARLPPCTLQPLVENAITYGVARDPEGGSVRIDARRSGTDIVVEVVNSCRSPAMTGPRGNGIALDNCRRRLALMYGASARFDASPRDEGSFCARIVLPETAMGPMA